MIILQKPFVSDCLVRFLNQSRVPVLRNEVSAAYPQLNLVDDEQGRQIFAREGKIYTMSENALEWIYQNLGDHPLTAKIALLKDKHRFREICRTMYPDYFFRQVAAEDLAKVDPAQLPLPVVVKPSVGFLSAGVYAVFDADDWRRAVADIGQRFATEAARFPRSVIGAGQFLLEEFIKGEEYAVDVYFTSDGRPVVVNIFHHPFSSGYDVSDRLYMTSKAIFDRYLPRFQAYLEELNRTLELRDMTIHIEMRDDGRRIIPIEINPMRFTGLCLNELFTYIDGRHPVEVFLEGGAMDYEAMWRGKEESVFSFSILERLPDGRRVDVDAVASRLSDVLEVRRPGNPDLPVEAFLFLRTEPARRDELDWLLRLDLDEFAI